MKVIRLSRGGTMHLHEDGNGVDVVLGFLDPQLPTRQYRITYRDVREVIAGLQQIIADRDARAAVKPGEGGLDEAEIERLADEAERGYPIESIRPKEMG